VARSGVSDDFADFNAVDGDCVARRRVRSDPFRRRLRVLFGIEDDHRSAGARSRSCEASWVCGNAPDAVRGEWQCP
jgi:hypothetical protein